MRNRLKKEIEVYNSKYPAASNVDILKFLKTGNQPAELAEVKKNTLNKFIAYQKKKFNTVGFIQKHKGGNGRKKVSKVVEGRIKRLAVNKSHRSSRKIASLVGVCHKTVANVLHRTGHKAYHKYRTQKLTDLHKENRVASAQALLNLYGQQFRNDRSWAKLINTDFSAKIKISPTRNSKNDVVWAQSRDGAGDSLESSEEKFSLGEMIWGGISARGLIPSESPIFVSDLSAGYNPRPKTVNSEMYADMIREKAGPAILALYPEGDAIFQDDNATIHRSRVSLTAVAETFNRRLDPAIQASKMADVYPIENIWSIIKTKLDSKHVHTLASLKRQIKIIWREIDQDKELCRKLMASIPKRLAAVISKDGSQIFKNDY